MMTTLLRLLGIRSDFERLFYVNEYKTLSGQKRRTILALILILFLTLLALGYAIGSIQNLERKMSNPFTNWVDLSISEAYISQKAKAIEEHYAKDEVKTAIQLDEVRGWVMLNVNMYHQTFNPISHPIDTLSYAPWGRSLDIDDPLMYTVLSADNILWVDPKINIEEEEGLENCEIIVTDEMLNRLGYPNDDPDIGYVFVREEANVIPIRIVGVVRELPKFCDFVCSSTFYNIKTGKIDRKGSCVRHIQKNEINNSTVFSFIIPENTDAQNIKTLAKKFFQGTEPPSVQINDSEAITVADNIWQVCEFSFMPVDVPTPDSMQQFLDWARSGGQPIGDILRLACETDDCNSLDPGSYHYLAFNFERLDDIRKFKDDIKENHNIDIDMSQVEAKENFALVSRLTFVISLVLLAFGVLSIILFVNNLLKTHLFKVRSNLGTFKAFGLSNRFLNTIYLKIIFSFLLVSIFVAFLASIIVDRVEWLFIGDESRFNIFSWWILAALVGLVVISLFISSKTIKKILGDTPGNLIYER